MRIYLATSKRFYGSLPAIQAEFERMGHEVLLPESMENPLREEEMKGAGVAAHREWKAGMIRKQQEKIDACDAVLVVNLEKDGQKDYIGGAVFLEIYQAWSKSKKVFLMRPIPQSIFTDELLAMNPAVINEDLSKIV